MAGGQASQLRLQRELQKMINSPTPEFHVDHEAMTDNLHTWYIEIKGADGTLYAGEKMRLRFKFSSDYPWKAPEIVFVGPNIPEHPHVYSNGHICLSILGDDWSPALSVSAICLSIISMLSSCKEKCKPPDDESYVRSNSGKSPRDVEWIYDDDTI